MLWWYLKRCAAALWWGEEFPPRPATGGVVKGGGFVLRINDPFHEPFIPLNPNFKYKPAVPPLKRATCLHGDKAEITTHGDAARGLRRYVCTLCGKELEERRSPFD